MLPRRHFGFRWLRRASGAALLALLAVILTPMLPASAEGAATNGAREAAGPRVPDSRADLQFSFAPLVRKVVPAVVNIYTRKVEAERERSPLFNDPLWRRLFPDEFGAGPVRKRVRTSLGSGVIVNANGIIITNVHVVKGADEIRVVLSDRREFDARVLLTDPRSDLAVLRIDTGGEKFPYLKLFDSDALEVGDIVLAIGNPFGVGQTVTSGIVSALARTAVGATDYQSFIQTDAAINPGNSGGALVTLDGRLAGINTAIYSRSGGSIGIGFAIPSAMVRAVLAGLTTGGHVVRPWLGASGQPVTAAIAESFDLSRPRGVIINDVDRHGPAAEAGLRQGDIVTAVNGLEVDDAEALRFRLATLPVGGTARLTVLRKGKTLQLRIALKPPPEIPPRDRTTIGGSNPLNGATVMNLSPAVADELALDMEARGVIVAKIMPGSIARRAGIKAGDVVRGVNGRATKTVASLRRALQQSEGADPWRITVARGGRAVTIVVRGIR